jgi:hypothetical protein
MVREFKFFDYSTPNDPSYYDIRGYEFIGVSEPFFDRNTLRTYKFLKYLHIETGAEISANIIHSDHPMFNYNN